MATGPKPPEDEWNVIYGKEWRRVGAIGSGAFGSVYIGQRVEDQMVFAVKSVVLDWPPRHPQARSYVFAFDSLCNEIRTLNALRCKYIVRVLGCGRSNGKNSSIKIGHERLYNSLDMFLEYIPRGSLHHLMKRLLLGLTTAKSDLKSGFKNPVQSQRVRRLPEAYVRAYTADILRGVDYLHNKQLVHGDIKCLNLLLAEDCLKLADFGGCKSLKRHRLIDFQTRTESYMAPEVYYQIEQGFASDIFSVGCCVLEMTVGSVPQPLFIPQWLSKDGQNFLRRCLTSDPNKRWTAAQLLQHPFIRDRDQNDLRPYSTAIPPLAERMILQPPPIEFYTNIPLSQTYQGSRRWRPHATPQVIAARVYGEKDSYRKERIEISVAPPPQDPAEFGKTPIARKVQFSSRPTTGAHDEDADVNQKDHELPVKLPAYKPEFEPPDDNSLHFLLPEGPDEEGKLDAETLGVKKPRPAPNAIPGRARPPRIDEPGYVTLQPDRISHLSWQHVRDFQQCNENIQEEALLAQEAGMYDNKLCPDAPKPPRSTARTASFLKKLIRRWF